MSTGRLIRRCVFAAPFVVTVAVAAPACKHAAPQQPQTNPPGPDVTPPTAPDKPGAWEQVGDAWQYKYEDGDAVWLGEDGQCRLVATDHCDNTDDEGKPVVVNCNPPPPQDVSCPPGRPGA